ncbi:MAG: Mu-like prophage major head subunit gpT family protein [Magnetococcales bacterium]|nr:Mu-like prophage major head subunit gpT family protein [Magnetococcales bacterium]
MIINSSNLAGLGIAFKAAFNKGFKGVEDDWQQIAQSIPSTSKGNIYPWLGELPGLREWIGKRHINAMGVYDYTIKNRKFEDTVAVPADDIKDDSYGTYAVRFEMMGKMGKQFPNQLVFAMLASGFSSLCYDKKPFFAADHPTDSGDVSNIQTGSSPAWYLLDTTQPLKPLIFQEREKYSLIAKEDPKSSDHVFMRDEYLYGATTRCNVGYGFWQTAFGSQAELTEANFDLAYDAMVSQIRRDDEEGKVPLGIKPNLLVVGASNRKKAAEILSVARKTDGTDNVNQGLVKILNTPWLI